MPPNDGFDHDAQSTYTLILWNGYIAYAVECPRGHTIWEMPYTLYPRKNPNYKGCPPVRPEADDD